MFGRGWSQGEGVYVCVCVCVSMCVHVCVLSHVQLFASPWTVACQAPLSIEFSRQEYWSWLPFPPPGDHPFPGIEPTPLESPVLINKCILYQLYHLASPLYRILASREVRPWVLKASSSGCE